MDNLKIIVVDDEETILNVFKQYLETTSNHTVLTAGDGLEALDIIKRENIDCCFTDISMPNLDGVALTREIHKHDNTIPVVVMTGYPSMDNAIDTLKNGVVDFLTKPIKMDQLLYTLDRVMRERSLFVDNILLKEEAKKNQKLREINQELKQKINELETFNLILQKLNQASTSKDLFKILVNLSGEVTSCDESHFMILSQGMSEYTIISSFVGDGKQEVADPKNIGKNIIKKVMTEKMPYLIKNGKRKGSLMAIPLKIRSEIFGILVSVRQDESCPFNERDLYFANFLTEKASSLIENLALYENIYENLFSTLYAFVEAIEARDPYTKQHSTRVSSYATLIAKAMGCSQEEIDGLDVAGNLHDIGKIGIPDHILLKPDKLTEEEYEYIKKHPVIGSNIVKHLCMWTEEQKIIRHHHERWDGTGYPDQLRGEQIPLLSRILSVADVYDAMTSDRSYRKKLKDDFVIKMIEENKGSQFDPKVVSVFIKLYKEGKIISANP
jgi:response regulator RpfG family c-di-GMP phosphodiesterase